MTMCITRLLELTLTKKHHLQFLYRVAEEESKTAAMNRRRMEAIMDDLLVFHMDDTEIPSRRGRWRRVEESGMEAEAASKLN